MLCVHHYHGGLEVCDTENSLSLTKLAKSFILLRTTALRYPVDKKPAFITSIINILMTQIIAYVLKSSFHAL